MPDDEKDIKLYIKTVCSFCLGGRRGGVFANCSYCNHERKTYIEAPLKEIAHYIQSLGDEYHNKLLELLYKDDNDPNDDE